MKPLLQVDGLRRRYGGRLVVDIDQLELRDGETLVILGPNGAGKSTLFRLLLLLEEPDAGRITLEGRRVAYGDRNAQRRLAGVFQRPFLFSGSVTENVGFGLGARGIRGRERDARVAEVLDWIGISHLARADVDTLSGGEAQRVALARALALRPELLLLDEPTANLDISVRRSFRTDLEELVRTRARAALVITHDPIDAFTLADRIAVIQSGRIVQVGGPDDLVTRPATTFIAALTGAEFLTDGKIRDSNGEEVMIDFPGGAQLHVRAPAAAPPNGTRVQVAYHPVEIEVDPRGAGSDGAPNHLRLRIAGLEPSGAMIRIRLEGALHLEALATRQSISSLGLTPGEEVTTRIEPSNLRVFPLAADNRVEYHSRIE